MGFKKEITNFDYGQTAIENIFINDFMPMANGTYVKVYLLGYKFAHDMIDIDRANNNMIARHLSIPLEDVLNAWEFWEKKGIIKRHVDKDDINYNVEFLSLRQLYINNNFSPIIAESIDTIERKSVENEKSNTLIEASKNPEIKNMFYQIDQIMRRQLTPKERMDILDSFYNFNIDPDVIVRAFEYSVDERNVKRVNYALKILMTWYDDGLLTLEDIDEYLKTNSTLFYSYKQIYKSLGYGSKQVTSGDKEIIDTWISKESLPLDFILEVLKENSKKTSNVNMNFMDAIISRLIGEGIKDVDSYKDMDRTPKKKPEFKENISNRTAPKNNNKFHNFKKSSTKYTNDELEKILGIKK
ncbi:MAG: DnaD domain protein [Acidaminobacteraceae bacterium]